MVKIIKLMNVKHKSNVIIGVLAYDKKRPRLTTQPSFGMMTSPRGGEVGDLGILILYGVEDDYSAPSLRISSILIADAGMRVPGPKMAATPAL